jgi:hypothetical protein
MELAQDKVGWRALVSKEPSGSIKMQGISWLAAKIGQLLKKDSDTWSKFRKVNRNHSPTHTTSHTWCQKLQAFQVQEISLAVHNSAKCSALPYTSPCKISKKINALNNSQTERHDQQFIT